MNGCFTQLPNMWLETVLIGLSPAPENAVQKAIRSSVNRAMSPKDFYSKALRSSGSDIRTMNQMALNRFETSSTLGFS